ncbi:MAG: sulfate transporter CysZ [Gammaproteobacteria bacterium HGW-Gammaproteobacteria-3]|nr:MAG: sulfate transporter CysZ [Gammaproteobacteria bacterium HGW-Gammaproteobacteria-3]
MRFAKKGNNPALTMRYFFQGLKMLGRRDLRKFILIPVLINIVLYSSVLVLAYYTVTDLIERFIPDGLSWLSWLLWPLFFISFFIAGFFTFTLLANLIAAPFYGKLSAKTLAIITGQPLAVAEQPLVKVLWAELRRGGYFLIRVLALLVLSFIPGLNIIAPFLWALFGAWGCALEYLAYPLENEGLLFAEQKQQIGSMRWGALGFGGVVMLGLTLPVFNILVAPTAVIGATLYFNKIRET